MNQRFFQEATKVTNNTRPARGTGRGGQNRGGRLDNVRRNNRGANNNYNQRLVIHTQERKSSPF